MHFHNIRRNNTKATATATSILTLAIIMAASNMVDTPALATTTTPPTSSGIELSSQPVYQTQEKLVSQSPINQTHAEFVVSANGTLTLPNGTESIRRSEEHTSELQSRQYLVCRLLLEKKTKS